MSDRATMWRDLGMLTEEKLDRRMIVPSLDDAIAPGIRHLDDARVLPRR